MTVLFLLLGAGIGFFLGIILNLFPGTAFELSAKHSPYYRLNLTYHCAILSFCYGFLALLAFLEILPLNHLLLLGASLLLSLYDVTSNAFPLIIGLLMIIPMALTHDWQSTTTALILLALLAEVKNIKIGSGDFLYLALLSFVISFQELLWVVQIASTLGILAFAIKKDRELAFVPYLSLAYLIVLIIHHTSL